MKEANKGKPYARPLFLEKVLVAAMKRDPTGGSKDTKEHAHNKGSFREYIELFSSGRIAIAMNEEQYAGKAPQHAADSQHSAPAEFTTPTQHATTTHTSTASLRSLLVRKLPNQNKTVERLNSPLKVAPCKQTTFLVCLVFIAVQ